MDGCLEPRAPERNREKAGANEVGTASKNATPPSHRAEVSGEQPAESNHAPTEEGTGQGKQTTKRSPRATDQRIELATSEGMEVGNSESCIEVVK